MYELVLCIYEGLYQIDAINPVLTFGEVKCIFFLSFNLDFRSMLQVDGNCNYRDSNIAYVVVADIILIMFKSICVLRFLWQCVHMITVHIHMH